MELRVCEVCKRMFQGIGENNVCPRCMISHEEAFNRVKDYLRKCPGTAMPILSEETGVSIPVLEQYLRQERIEIAPNSQVMLACNKCGAEIVTGMYCEPCGRSIIGEFQKIKNTMIAEERAEKGKLKYVQAKWRSK